MSQGCRMTKPAPSRMRPSVIRIKVQRMQHDRKTYSPRIAIIGAGMAGISCAHALQQQDLAVTLFDKSRGIGGRLATRRTDGGDSFDHGAQYITTRSADFSAFIDRLRHDGAAAEWQPRLGTDAEHHPWFVGTPGMSALLKPLAEKLDIRLSTTVSTLEKSGNAWQLHRADGALSEPYDVVISTAPPVQTRALFADDPLMQTSLDAVSMAPCWTLMIAFTAPLDVDFDARRFDTGAISWLARQASRPEHGGNLNAWVVHAGAEWSAEHLELTPEQAAGAMQQELARTVGQASPDTIFVQAHRWRYAMTTQALGQPFLANTDRSLFAGGDWCLGASVECAYQSGVAIAEAVSKRLRTD
jgi:renalase